MVRPPALALAIAFASVLSACAAGTGGSGVPLPSSPDGVETVADAAAVAAHHATGSQNAAAAIAVADALGSRIKAAGDESDAIALGESARHPNAGCVAGVEFFAPDRHGDPNSTETLRFYDRGCRRLAVDAVRSYAPGSAGTETESATVSFFTLGHSNAPAAILTATSQISGASFDRYGMPIASSGYHRLTQSQLVAGGQKHVLSDAEILVAPTSTAASVFCQDAAGYDVAGVASLDATFGWQGGTLAGQTATRTDNGNGYITWRSTQRGRAFQGAIGSLSIAAGAPNASCPIVSPGYTLSGGTAIGTYTIPLTVTFYNGQLSAIAVAKASLGDGFSLDVKTGGRSPSSAIRGRIAAHGMPIASFAVNVFGNGALTITSTGAEYPIVDWSVVR